MSSPPDREAIVTTGRRLPTDVAASILKEKYPNALFAFVGGSFNRGEATLYSDIDLVVIFQTLDHAWRESFVFEDWPVEAFVHDPETLRYFFQEVDAKSAVLSLPAMVMEGPVVPCTHPMAVELKALAQGVLNGQPALWDLDTLDSKRYRITDLIDDLRDPRTDLEAAATIGILHEELGDFYFRSKGWWSASKKHIPRRLAAVDPALALRWNEAFIEAWRGQPDKVVLLAHDILTPCGGFLFAGYRRNAPPAWRTGRYLLDGE